MFDKAEKLFCMSVNLETKHKPLTILLNHNFLIPQCMLLRQWDGKEQGNFFLLKLPCYSLDLVVTQEVQ